MLWSSGGVDLGDRGGNGGDVGVVLLSGGLDVRGGVGVVELMAMVVVLLVRCWCWWNACSWRWWRLVLVLVCRCWLMCKCDRKCLQGQGKVLVIMLSHVPSIRASADASAKAGADASENANANAMLVSVDSGAW